LPAKPCMFIVGHAGKAACLRARLSSNVRHHMGGAFRYISSATGISALLLSSGLVTLTYDLILASTQSKFTGVVRTCASTYEPGFSAPSLPPDEMRRGLKCQVEFRQEGAKSDLAEVSFDVSDPAAKHLRTGSVVEVVGIRFGPWLHFRPSTYSRDLGTLQFGVFLVGFGVVLRALRSDA